MVATTNLNRTNPALNYSRLDEIDIDASSENSS